MSFNTNWPDHDSSNDERPAKTCQSARACLQSLAFPKTHIPGYVWTSASSRNGSQATGLPLSRANSTRLTKNICIQSTVYSIRTLQLHQALG
ncbi:hypothetical protein Pdw03_1680 [Penicillium digitatum]|uniref:Uncharacterized protein n=1 Tax=Penicillium digitatum TaxID=36651 RepID=A0A7T6XT73_PENDI|nr:hypothetical protein Pdw03_1680 [Penicillium digitatum]